MHTHTHTHTHTEPMSRHPLPLVKGKKCKLVARKRFFPENTVPLWLLWSTCPTVTTPHSGHSSTLLYLTHQQHQHHSTHYTVSNRKRKLRPLQSWNSYIMLETMFEPLLEARQSTDKKKTAKQLPLVCLQEIPCIQRNRGGYFYPRREGGRLSSDRCTLSTSGNKARERMKLSKQNKRRRKDCTCTFNVPSSRVTIPLSYD